MVVENFKVKPMQKQQSNKVFDKNKMIKLFKTFVK